MRKDYTKYISLIFIIYFLCLLKLTVFRHLPAIYDINALVSYFRNFFDVLSNTSKEVIMQRLLSANVDFMNTIRSYYTYGFFNEILYNIVGNIVAFIPFTYLLSFSRKNYGSLIFMGILLSVFIECLQLITGFGIFDIDDILLNSIGSLLGFIIFYLLHLLPQHLKKWYYQMYNIKND